MRPIKDPSLNEALRTLFHPFESGVLDIPAAEERGLFLNAKPGFVRPTGFAAGLACIQGFRPDYLALLRQGEIVVPQAEGAGHPFAFVLADRHRGATERHLADALRRVRDGGLVVVAGGKEEGITALRRRVGALTPIEGALSKYHGQVFWIRRTAPGALIAGLEAANPASLVDNRFVAEPGMFSHDRIDAGSRLLAGQLPTGFVGDAADFCAGWGFLAASLAERSPGLRTLDLYEADHASLEAARRNLSGSPVAPDLFWHDLAGEPLRRSYDLIVMNPPFHQARAADPGLGLAMISAAASALKRGGRLLIVANRGLPYEAGLRRLFKTVERVDEDAAFRVFAARC